MMKNIAFINMGFYIFFKADTCNKQEGHDGPTSIKWVNGEQLQASCTAEGDGLSNFGKGPPKNQSFKVWLKSAQC